LANWRGELVKGTKVSGVGSYNLEREGVERGFTCGEGKNVPRSERRSLVRKLLGW